MPKNRELRFQGISETVRGFLVEIKENSEC